MQKLNIETKNVNCLYVDKKRDLKKLYTLLYSEDSEPNDVKFVTLNERATKLFNNFAVTAIDYLVLQNLKKMSDRRAKQLLKGFLNA